MALALGLGLITVIIGAFSLTKLKTQYNVLQFLPKNHPALRMDSAVRRRFHINDRPTFIGVLTLRNRNQGDWLQAGRVQKLSALTLKIKALNSVDEAISVANVEGAAQVEGSLSVGELVKLVPKNEWKNRILKDNLLTPNLIAEDGRTVLIYVMLKSASISVLTETEAKLKSMLASTFPEADTSIGGVPAVQTDLSLLLNKELLHFLVLTVIACALTLLMIFRTLSTIWIPLILVVYCNIMVLAFIALSGLTFTILSSTIPILVFIDVMTISCHILLRIHEEAQLAQGESKWSLILRTNRSIWLPNLLGSVTTSVGFLTLLYSDVPLIQSYGKAAGISILLSSVLTSLGIMPLLLAFPFPTPREWVHRPARWALWIIQRRKQVVAATVATCALCAIVGRQLDWTGRLFDDLPKGHEARQSTEQIDSTMGGVVPLDVIIRLPKGNKKDWSDPHRISKLDHLVEDLRQIPGVGTAQSLPDFLRASGLHQTRLPASRAAIAETYFVYSMSPANPMANYVTSDNRSARIGLKIHDLPSDQVKALLSKVRRKAQSTFPDSLVQMGGMGAVVHTVNDEISHDLIFGFWEALGLIILVLIPVFRSLRWALVAAVPNLIPPIALLGFLAVTDTPIKPGVAIIFSIALGLAFTNTIYALNRLRQLRRPGRPLPIKRTFHLEGNPCLVSTLVVMMGFSVFLFSYFQLNRTFGACMLVSIVAGMVGDLMFLPALLKMAPWLLDSKAIPTKDLRTS